ncbi:hypothetical protein [Sinorhizobium meliloti]|uniref:hypothetical protein n=1 Tax=Rhizobium meliloti TaxID=382 RepID=UPI00299E27A9|nr:hypothetical protein [Sinorhizobium meliloti]MDW9991036.1 hypothetical protein [Sinorhizobium meliloti]MDX0245436.1 hypothetical protein [Sinorhizobium meliloti]MDX0401560.1 hypothetical protein [Sinorhizobium meliloti]
MITLKFNEHVIPKCEPSPDSVPCWFTLYEGGEWHHISRFNRELGFHSLQYEDGNVYDAQLKAVGYSPWRKVDPIGKIVANGELTAKWASAQKAD